jgi:hypothetical protein
MEVWAILDHTSANKGRRLLLWALSTIWRCVNRSNGLPGNAPERAERSCERMWTSRAALGHGAGRQARQCEVCKENDKGACDVELAGVELAELALSEVRNALLLWLQGQALSCADYAGEPSDSTG